MKILHSKILNSESTQTPLVILHGLFGMSDNWNSLGKKFAETRPVHLLDLRNHGDSFHEDEMSLELMAEDLARYFSHYHISDCDLLGHSLGGKVALTYINEYTETVKKGIIVDIGIKSYPPHHQNILKGLQDLDFNLDNSRKLIDQKLQEFIPEIAVRQFLMKNIDRIEKNAYQFRMNVDSIQKNYLSLLKEIKPNGIIETPILFIKGEYSDYIEPQEIITIKNYYPNATLMEVSDAGHWVHAQNPDQFYRVVENYIDQ